MELGPTIFNKLIVPPTRAALEQAGV